MTDQELNARFAEWATWVRSKRLYSPSPNPRSIIGGLVLTGGGEPADRALSAEMARLHLAVISAGDRGSLVAAHYLLRPYYRREVGTDKQGRPIYKRRKVRELAEAVGYSPASWSRSVKRACREIWERAESMHGYSAEMADR
jgi:hypothetical protein